MIYTALALSLVGGLAAAHPAWLSGVSTSGEYGTVSYSKQLMHDAENQRVLVTDITKKPHVMAGFQANFFSNSCDDGFIGQVTGAGGTPCTQSVPGTKAITLLSKPDNCEGTAVFHSHDMASITLTGLSSYRLHRCFL
jgi:hypothetical protein